MPISEDVLKGAGVLVPINGLGTSELTAGLLGAKLDPVRASFGIDGRYVSEVRLLEIERRILAIEAAIAMEARQRRDAEERPDPKDDSAGRQASPGHTIPTDTPRR